MPERLLDDQPRPALRGPPASKRVDNGRKHARWDSEVVDAVTRGPALFVELGEGLSELVLAALVGEVHREVAETVGQRLPHVLAELGPRVLLDGVVHDLQEVLVRPVAAGEPDEGESRR